MTNSKIKSILYIVSFSLLLFIGCILPFNSSVLAANNVPKFNTDFVSQLTNEEETYLLSPSKFGIDKDKTLRENIRQLFYPSSNSSENQNQIYQLIKGVLLGVMICFIVWAGASLLFNRKPEDMKKTLWSLIYILIGGVFVYAANRLFGSVLNFDVGSMVASEEGQKGIGAVVNAFTGYGKVMFIVLSAIKAFAFFMAIILIVVTGFRVIAAGEGEKGKKLVKGLINIGVALLVIKGIDFIYYLAADSSNFVQNASDFIINFAKIFAYIYGAVIIIMVIVAGYLYMTDGGSGSNFKKASNILVNILLSGLVLFSFLLILYQIFAEFQTGGDAVSDATALLYNNKFYV